MSAAPVLDARWRDSIPGATSEVYSEFPGDEAPSGIVHTLPLRGAVILLVHSDEAYLDVMTLILRMDGAEVRAAASATAAIRTTAGFRPNVLLGDPSLIDVRVHFALRLEHASPLVKVGVVDHLAAPTGGLVREGYDEIVCKSADIGPLMARLRRHLRCDFGEVFP